MFDRARHRGGGHYPDLGINGCPGLNQGSSFHHTGRVLLWASMMDGAGSLSLWLTASLGVQTTTACRGTQTGPGGLPRGLSLRSHPSLIPDPLSLCIRLCTSPSTASRHPSQRPGSLPHKLNRLRASQTACTPAELQTITSDHNSRKYGGRRGASAGNVITDRASFRVWNKLGQRWQITGSD